MVRQVLANDYIHSDVLTVCGLLDIIPDQLGHSIGEELQILAVDECYVGHHHCVCTFVHIWVVLVAIIFLNEVCSGSVSNQLVWIFLEREKMCTVKCNLSLKRQIVSNPRSLRECWQS